MMKHVLPDTRLSPRGNLRSRPLASSEPVSSVRIRISTRKDPTGLENSGTLGPVKPTDCR